MSLMGKIMTSRSKTECGRTTGMMISMTLLDCDDATDADAADDDDDDYATAMKMSTVEEK